MFAARQPFKVAAGAYLFGAALALSPALQSRGYAINQFALDAVPYVCDAGWRWSSSAGGGSNEVPEGLSKVFDTPTVA